MSKKNDHTSRARGARGNNSSAELLGSNSEIGRKLKQYYDELVSDEVPDRFASLLAELEQAEHAGAGKPAEGETEG